MKKFLLDSRTTIADRLLDELIKMLGNEESARRLLNSDPLPSSLAWERTIKLGLENSPEKYRLALLKNSRIGMSASDMLKCVAVSRRKAKLDLVALSVAHLGLKDAKFSTICATGLERGYKLCPAEAAIVLRIVYPDQPGGERLHVAMKAIASDEHPSIFTLEHDNSGLCLYGGSGHPDLSYGSDALFVFVKPRRK